MRLGTDFKNDITSCILGAKGSGKSVLLAIMVYLFPGKCVLLDMLGVYNPEAKRKTAVIPNSYYFLTVKEFIKYYKDIPKNGKCVINMSEYIGEELIQAVDALCKFLMDKKDDIALFSDEAADFMPQQGKTSYWFHQLAKNGRNYGIQPIVFATQRPQSVDKSVFDLCDKFYISKQRAPRTVEYILDIVDAKGDKEMLHTINQLQSRQFLVYDGDIEFMQVPNYPYAFAQRKRL